MAGRDIAWRGEYVLAWPQAEGKSEAWWDAMARRFAEKGLTDDEVVCAVQWIAAQGGDWAPGWGQVYRIALDRCGAKLRMQLARQREVIETVRRADAAAG